MHIRYLYYSILLKVTQSYTFKEEEDDIKDVYKKFAYDYDEFGDIKDYLGPEKRIAHVIIPTPKSLTKI